MPGLGFEPTIPVFERAKTVHALDCAATVIGTTLNRMVNNELSRLWKHMFVADIISGYYNCNHLEKL
jgi:hypothetical protein